jgi:ribosomal protein L37AE/L43A
MPPLGARLESAVTHRTGQRCPSCTVTLSSYRKLGQWYFYCSKCMQSYTKDAKELPLEAARPTLRDLFGKLKV